MNKKTFKQLRHNIRASGWQWNWGSRMATGSSHHADGSYGHDYKSKSIALVASTILHVNYDQPLTMAPPEEDSSGVYMVLWKEWRQAKTLPNTYRTPTWWRNYMRANVRQDSRVFTHQLWPV